VGCGPLGTRNNWLDFGDWIGNFLKDSLSLFDFYRQPRVKLKKNFWCRFELTECFLVTDVLFFVLKTVGMDK